MAKRRKSGSGKKTSKKKGLTSNILLKSTPNKISAAAKDVEILGKKDGLTNAGNPQIVFKTMSLEPTTKRQPPKHKTIVRLIDPRYKRLWVSCQCEWFLFNCEYSLTKYGASSIIYSNGEPAIITNPRNIPWVCKHLVRVLRLKNTGNKLLRLARENIK